MRSVLLALVTISMVASTAHGDTQAVQERLEKLRRMREEAPLRRKVAVLPFANKSPKAGAEAGLAGQVEAYFTSKGFEPVDPGRVTAAAAAHAAGADWTEADLAQAATAAGAETVVFGTLLDFRAKKTFGLPLPGSYIRTHANVEAQMGVFKKSTGKIVWQDKHKRHDTVTLGGAAVTKDSIRQRSGEKLIAELAERYFKLHGSK